MADADEPADQQSSADERPSDHMNILRFGLYAATQALQFTIFTVIIFLVLRDQHVPTDADVQRLEGAIWQTVALAIGFALSIPLYLFIGQWAFAVWAAASLLGNVIRGQRRRWAAKAA